MVAWLDRAPSWLQVESVEADRVQAVSGDPDLGEREAIALVQVVHSFYFDEELVQSIFREFI